MKKKSTVKRRTWTKEQKQWILDYYANHNFRETCEEFYKIYGEVIGENTVRHVASEVGYHKHNFITKEEKEWLQEYYKTHNREETRREYNRLFNKNASVSGMNLMITRYIPKEEKKSNEWTEEQIKMFGEYYEKFGAEVAAQKASELLGKKINKCVISNFACKNGYSHLRDDMYTEEQKEFVRQCYDLMTCEELTKRLNETFGIKKTVSGVRGLYGRLGLNTKCVPVETGETTVWKDKNAVRTLIKLEDGTLYPYASYVWEKHYNKKVPKGYKVTFKDGDYTNFNINNLVCVSHRTHAMLNFNNWRGKGVLTDTAIMYGEFLEADRIMREGLK